MAENVVPKQRGVRWVTNHRKPRAVIQEPSNDPTGGLGNSGHIVSMTTTTNDH
jgi:hypothetical protein